MPRLTSLAQSLPASVPFVGPEAQERARGEAFTARLGANESGFGPSPKALDAIARAGRDAWMYGDPEAHDLRHALAEHHRIDADAIMPGEGVDGLLGSLVRLFVGSGDAVVTSAGAYPTFNYHVTGFGGVVHTVPYRDDHEDPDALIAKAIEVGAKLIYLANPDNPMGSWHTAARVSAMIDTVPEGCLLCLDEAYAELAPPDALPRLDPKIPHVIRMRSFSKAYGLAGMRIGYAIGHPDVIRAFDKVRNHFGLGRVSQEAAIAALQDADWLEHVRAEIAQARRHIAEIARTNGLTPLPSATNFVAIDCGRDGDYARSLLSGLIQQGIFVRMPGVPPLDRCIRISCGPEEELAALASALPVVIESL